MELIDEEDTLNQLVSQIDFMKTGLPDDSPLQPYVLTVHKQAHASEGPPGTEANASHSENKHNTTTDPLDPIDLSSINLRQLAQLHRKLKSTQQRRNRAQALCEQAVQQALWREDVHAFRSRRRRVSFARGLTDVPPNLCTGSDGTSWYWHAYVRPWATRAAAVILAVLSLVVVWSECTFFVQTPTLSVIALILKVEARMRDYFLLEISSFLALSYLSVAVFYTVFRLRIFNYYRLVGSHHTDENSLLFCGALLCRLTPSLCLNFLGLIHLDSHLSQTTLYVPQPVGDESDSTIAKVGEAFTSVHNLTVETAYTQFMGHLDMIPIIANGFNIYFPILVVLLCLMTYFRLGSRLLHQLGIPQLVDTSAVYASDRQSMDSLVDDAINDGRLLVRKERLARSKLPLGSGSDEDLTPETSRYSNAFPSDRVHLLRSASAEDRLRSYSEVRLNPDGTSEVGHTTATPKEYSEHDIEQQFSFRSDYPMHKTSRW